MQFVDVCVQFVGVCAVRGRVVLEITLDVASVCSSCDLGKKEETCGLEIHAGVCGSRDLAVRCVWFQDLV